MPWRMETLMSAVLAHWAHPDAILQSRTPDLDWGKELWYRLPGWLWVDCCARRYLLGGCVVRNTLGCDISNVTVVVLRAFHGFAGRRDDRKLKNSFGVHRGCDIVAVVYRWRSNVRVVHGD